jgi:hypothetical protein
MAMGIVLAVLGMGSLIFLAYAILSTYREEILALLGLGGLVLAVICVGAWIDSLTAPWWLPMACFTAALTYLLFAIAEARGEK